MASFLSTPRRRLAAAALLATVATLALSALDQWRLRATSAETGLRMGRQLGQMVDGLVLAAKRHAEPDPVAWAAEALDQGVEPRSIRVARVRAAPGEPRESHRLDAATNTFEYTRLAGVSDDEGTRIRIDLGYSGFLAARSPWASDFLKACVWLLFATAASLAIRLRVAPPAWAGAWATEPLGASATQLVADWLSSGRDLLTRQATSLRELIREANNLAHAAARSREATAALREKVHGGLREVHLARRELKEAVGGCQAGEAAALNLVLEAARAGDGGHRLAALAEELHRAIQRARKANQRLEATILGIEKSLEPWAMDADLAFNAYDDVFRASRGMDGHITGTTETISAQSRLLSELREREAKLAAEAARPAAPEALVPEQAAVAPIKKARRRSRKNAAEAAEKKAA